MNTLKEIYFEILGYEITEDEKLAIKKWLLTYKNREFTTHEEELLFAELLKDLESKK